MALPITHVIFDVDGLLLDSERLYDIINDSIMKEYGKTLSTDVKRKIMGKKETEVAKILIDEFELPITTEEFLQEDRKQQAVLLPNVELLPGAEKLVRHLHRHGVPIAVATGSSKRSMGLKTTRHKDLFDLFHHFVYSSDDPEVTCSKPAPDCFLLAARRFPDNPDSNRCLVLEDACNGVMAAHAAGMQCVWVPDPTQPQDGYREKATLTLDSLLQFKPEQFGLPPYDSEDGR
ncbi:pseudouridine-5'-phosphatase-like [Pecten maximus]|uniref:pseudouridine-5'-phosphatase-like n=1 Tax=Pecten maximus TaxID=6579 RepID=UPI00145833F3|nr:pseudouridine-5'-phosphatase-like [Pecten maximus]